jgi:hypothetical protein
MYIEALTYTVGAGAMEGAAEGDAPAASVATGVPEDAGVPHGVGKAEKVEYGVTEDAGVLEAAGEACDVGVSSWACSRER